MEELFYPVASHAYGHDSTKQVTKQDNVTPHGENNPVQHNENSQLKV